MYSMRNEAVPDSALHQYGTQVHEAAEALAQANPPRRERRMRRSPTIGLAMVPLLAAGLTGCGQKQEASHQAVCIDQNTQQRVDDDRCGDDEDHYFGYYGGYGWWYYPHGYAYPPLGGSVRSYRGGIDSSSPTARSQVGSSFAPARGASASGGTLRTGTTVSRGGFGRSGGSFFGG